jgi:hypothetical protein
VNLATFLILMVMDGFISQTGISALSVTKATLSSYF